GVAPQAPYPTPLAKRPLRRQTPEVGAVCGQAARTDLCGGWPEMAIPTAIGTDRLGRGEPKGGMRRVGKDGLDRGKWHLPFVLNPAGFGTVSLSESQPPVPTEAMVAHVLVAR